MRARWSFLPSAARAICFYGVAILMGLRSMGNFAQVGAVLTRAKIPGRCFSLLRGGYTTEPPPTAETRAG